MIEADAIRDIIATYTKHGWLLRRVLLSARSKKALDASIRELFDDVGIRDSAIDAAWFSRPPKEGGVAWELRYLGSTPFSLVEKADENAVDCEQILREVEQRLHIAIGKKESA